MDIYKKWTIQLKNNISGGALWPTMHSFDRSAYYISDGVGSAYASMRLRKLSLETGEELANVLTRDMARCIYANNEHIFAVLDKRILKLNRDDLRIEHTYRQGVPRYIDYVNSDDANTLLLMNRMGPYFHRFDLTEETSLKKKVNGGCCGIEKADADTFLVFNYDSIFQYNLKTNTMKKMVDTEHYERCVRGASGRVYLLCTEPAQMGGDAGKAAACSSRMLVYPPTLENGPQEIVPGRLFQYFWLSEDESLLYCYYNDSSRDALEDIRNTLWLYSIPRKEIIFQHQFHDGYIFDIIAEEGIVLTYHWDMRDNDYRLNCWKIVLEKG